MIKFSDLKFKQVAPNLHRATIQGHDCTIAVSINIGAAGRPKGYDLVVTRDNVYSRAYTEQTIEQVDKLLKQYQQQH